jgi:alpha-tubulin suppressor-like RCC1 family protein
VTAIAGGANHRLALLSDGTVLAWGYNGNGELGDGTSTGPERCRRHEAEAGYPCSHIPVPVTGLREVTAVAVGIEHSLALLKNGTVVSWGRNELGQLGNGTTTDSDVPVPVAGLGEVTAIAADEDNSLALLKDGTVMAWGPRHEGSGPAPEECLQFGRYHEACSKVPRPVPGLSGVASIAKGANHSLALLSKGTVMAWGYNASGQLGNETDTLSDAPVPVTGLSEVTAIAAGNEASLALLRNGTVNAWGDNLGNGTWNKSDVPVPVTGLSEVTAIASGGGYADYPTSLALLKNGAVKAWGLENREGQLGDGTTTEHNTPVQVSGLTRVTAISFDVAISSLPAVTRVDPNDGSFAGGTTVSITGINFTGDAEVKFGSTDASNVTVQSPTQITAVSPPGTGIVDVTVTTGEGTSAMRPADRFTYEPTVTGVQPSFGRPRGGTAVTITGTNFNGVTAVMFGATRARRFVVHSPTSIAATAPSGAGTADITVVTPGGTSAVSFPDLFTWTTIDDEWAVVPTPQVSGRSGLGGVSCASHKFCAAVGRNGASGGGPEFEAWNGAAWSTVAGPVQPPPKPPGDPNEPRLSGVSCSSSKFCVAVGSSESLFPGHGTPFGQSAYIYAWNGTRWSNAESLLASPGENSIGRIEGATLSGASCASSSFCVAVGTLPDRIGEPLGRLLASWNGSTWSTILERQKTRLEDSGLEGVSCVSTKFCMAVGSQQDAIKQIPHTLTEMWNGTGWSVVPSPDRGSRTNVLNGISCTSATRCIAVGYDYNAGPAEALMESWNGGTWSILESPNIHAGAELKSVSCVSSSSCVAVGRYGSGFPHELEQGFGHALVEASKGSQWWLVPSPNPPGSTSELHGVSCVWRWWERKHCFAVGRVRLTPEGPFQTLAEQGGL